MKIEDILVPIDFSPGSLRALDYALAMVDPSGEVYLLHVVDDDFLARLAWSYHLGLVKTHRSPPDAKSSCGFIPSRFVIFPNTIGLRSDQRAEGRR